jgi:hypothetical protein
MLDQPNVIRTLAQEVASTLGSGWELLPGATGLRRKRAEGNDVALLIGSADDEGGASVALHVGRSFDAAREVERRWQAEGPICDIQQIGARLVPVLETQTLAAWIFQLPAQADLAANSVAESIRALGEPFYVRFTEMPVARDAIAGGDRWCVGGPLKWAIVLKLDLALDDLHHFQEWSKGLPTATREQAEFLVQSYAQNAA